MDFFKHTSLRIASIAVLLSTWCSAHALGGLIDELVFAHDFESISGNTIIALVGPNATKTSDISVDTADPIPSFSTQHVQAPSGSAFATVNTNSQLISSTTALSFSMFYNARGDNGYDGGGSNQARFLSSFSGSSTPAHAYLGFDSNETSATTRQFRFFLNDGVGSSTTEISTTTIMVTTTRRLCGRGH